MASKKQKVPAGINTTTAGEGRVGGTHPLHAGDAGEGEAIRKRRTHRLTLRAKAFIIRLINSGYNDAAINQILRQKKFIMPGEEDLSYSSLYRLRNLDECALDTDLLTLEARQVGHHMVSKAVVFWANVLEAAYEKLMGLPFSDPNYEKMGNGLKSMSAGECCALMTNATKFLADTFAKDLGDKLKGELTAAESGLSQPVQLLPDATEIGMYVEELIVNALKSAAREEQDLLLPDNADATPAEGLLTA